MIDVIIRGNLGSFGSAILDFYIENSLWINGIILLYVFVLVLAKRSFTEILQNIKNDLVKSFGNDIFVKNEKNFLKIVGRHHFDWEKLAKINKIPVFSVEKSWIFQVKTATNLSKYFTPGKIYSLVKKEADPTAK